MRRPRHRDHAALVFQRVPDAVGGEFAADLIPRPAATRAGRVAALNHKAADDAVKNQSVIKAAARELDEIRHRFRRVFLTKLDHHFFAVFHFDSCFLHGFFSCFIG